ncbi:hypothetical protein [Mammaliicoccus vitulinus]|uniref:hypothetical protein n=1 Tax=Mammaliicoccus vitulinus TaxID=71237 RepID=UPI00248B39D7|nr:hypothetical protein [Mammaliicoccus vitulinus]
MNEGSEKKFWIIVTIIIIVVGVLAYKYVIMYDTSGTSSGSSHVQRNEEPALTLKSDKEAQEQKDNKAKDDDDKDKDKSEDNKDDDETKNKDIKALKTQAKENAITVLDIQSKPKDEFKSDSTQARFKEAATTKFVKTRQDNDNKDDKTIRYKNVELKIDDEKDFEKDTVKGELKFDRLINPKGKDSKVESSTAVDSKLSVIFKKEDNKFKVSQLQM